MRLLKYFSIIALLALMSCSAKLSNVDNESRFNADKTVSLFLSDDIKDCKHIIFSVAEKDFIIIVEKPNYYVEYFYNKSKNIVNVKKDKVIYNKPNELFKKMFNKDIYRKEFITFNSDFFSPEYEISSGNITYFVLKDEKSKRYGEARLSFFIKPNPIDAEVYLYLTNRIMEYNSIN